MQLRRLLATTTIALAAISGSVVSAPASAYHPTYRGSPGDIAPYQAQGSHFNTCPGLLGQCFTAWIHMDAPRVYRSPASNSTQRITYLYLLQRWNGSAWVRQAEQTGAQYLSRGYGSIRMPAADFYPAVAGYFRVHIIMGWSNRNDTVTYGTSIFTYDEARDYVCSTRWPCQVGDGWVWLQGPA